MTPMFQLYTWAVSIVCSLIAMALLKTRWLGLILGILLAQGLMFLGAHKFGVTFGPTVTFAGMATPVPIVADIVLALIGAFIGAGIARAFRRR